MLLLRDKLEWRSLEANFMATEEPVVLVHGDFNGPNFMMQGKKVQGYSRLGVLGVDVIGNRRRIGGHFGVGEEGGTAGWRRRPCRWIFKDRVGLRCFRGYD